MDDLKQPPIAIEEMIPSSSEPTILMFSDIEGCQADPKNPQSIALCSPLFYNKIAEMLRVNKKLEVAFLGDYFDQGMHVHSSITGMEMLLDDKDFVGRVHVILGNRDVNKLRFMYELVNSVDVLPSEPTGSRWKAWAKYYDELNGKTGVDLVKHILITSMGANKKEGEKMTGLYSFMPFDNIASADDATALIYLKSALRIPLDDGETAPEDRLDLIRFFGKCKLAHVFNDKVLMAHGGGFDPDAFFDQPYVDSFNPEDGFVLDGNYSFKLEEFRKKLSGKDQKGGAYTDREKAERYGNDQTKRNKYGRKPVQYSVDVYNTLLKEVIDELSKGNFTWKFVLLQALGLKPDEPEDARYKSLIQSCSQDGCKGQNIPLDNDKDGKKLEKILKASGITHVSYGHKPVCFPIPLIYRRPTISGVTFISNDTSNAKRTIIEIGENTVVGTSVTFKSNDIVTQVRVITLDGTTSPAEEKYKAIFGPYSNKKKPPVYVETPGKETTLEYDDGVPGGKLHKLLFNNLYTYPPDLRAFDLLKYEEAKPAEAQMVGYDSSAPLGGKRRSRHRKQQRSKRGSKRGGSKKTRRSKHKHTKHGRNARK